MRPNAIAVNRNSRPLTTKYPDNLLAISLPLALFTNTVTGMSLSRIIYHLLCIRHFHITVDIFFYQKAPPLRVNDFKVLDIHFYCIIICISKCHLAFLVDIYYTKIDHFIATGWVRSLHDLISLVPCSHLFSSCILIGPFKCNANIVNLKVLFEGYAFFLAAPSVPIGYCKSRME